MAANVSQDRISASKRGLTIIYPTRKYLSSPKKLFIDPMNKVKKIKVLEISA